MGRYERALWQSDGSGYSRAARTSGSYEYFVPTPLRELEAALAPDVVGDLSRAESRIVQLNEEAVTLRSTEGIARLLLRAEAISSSYIEGLEMGPRRLLRAEFEAERKREHRDTGATEIIGNIRAMDDALEHAVSEETITVETVLSIHRRLSAGTRFAPYGGVIRTTQNWIGGNDSSPLQAAYIPPAPECVTDLLDDLAEYCNRDDVSPVFQAAVVHAQFEAIHPFSDGNGRTGRALIHLILRRRGTAPRVVPPISLVLATQSKSYIDGLNSFRAVDGHDEENRQGLDDWLSTFAGACVQACDEALRFEQIAMELVRVWTERLGSVRAGSAAEKLLETVFGSPVFDVRMMVDATGFSPPAVAAAVRRLADAGIITQTSPQRRNRVFEVPEILEAFTLFERGLASPVGDTAIAPPVRTVPYPPHRSI